MTPPKGPPSTPGSDEFAGAAAAAQVSAILASNTALAAEFRELIGVLYQLIGVLRQPTTREATIELPSGKAKMTTHEGR
jgi:hypothetical protein